MTDAASEILADDEKVLATKWEMPPGSETGHHTHQHAYIVVYLSDGMLTVATDVGDEIQVEVNKHDLTSRPAGVSHNVMNRSESTVHFIEIELK